MEIYVTPVDDSRAGRIVSTNGGLSPRWSQEGDELFFLSLSGSMMAVSVSLEPSFHAGRATALFAGEFDKEYDVIRAGPHFVPGEAVLRLTRRGQAIEAFNGPGHLAWEAAGKMQKNGQRSISLSTLERLMRSVPQDARLPQRTR